MTPTLKQLQYFVALYDTCHFGRAAEQCYVVQSALSNGIKELETALDVQLFERNKRQVQPTQQSKKIVAIARDILSQVDNFVELSSDFNPLQSTMKLGVIPTICPFLLPQIMPQIQKAFPRLRIYLQEEKTSLLLKQLQKGNLDAVIIAFPYPHKKEDIASMELFVDNFSLALPHNHPLAGKKKKIELEQIPDDQLLVLEDGHCLREHVLVACSISNEYTKSDFVATSLHSLLQMVANNLGISVVPNMAVGSDMVRSLQVCFRNLNSNISGRRIALCWRQRSTSASAYRQFGARIQTIMRQKTR